MILSALLAAIAISTTDMRLPAARYAAPVDAEPPCAMRCR